MNQPTVSIIIPCYNAEKYVGEAIRSALDQTYPHTEVIVIDDGSTDGSLEAIKSFGDALRWETGPNRGACAARNRGLELAQGELIQFLDADDLLLPEKLERLVPHAAKWQPHSVYCDGEIVSRSGETRVHAPESAGVDAVVFALREWTSTLAPLHHAETLRSVGGFSEHLPCSQERDLHLRLACAGLRFYHIPETLYKVRGTDGSVSSNWKRALDQRCQIFTRAFQMLRSGELLSDERRRAFAEVIAKDARSYLYMGHFQNAVEQFDQAMRIHNSGGLHAVYNHSLLCWLHRLLGPITANRIVAMKRQFTGRSTA